MSETRKKLTEIAFELFGRNGFHAIGLDAILAEAKLSKQTFYNHFDSKDDLVLAVLTLRHEVEGNLFARLFSEVAGEDPKARLYALIDVLERWFNRPDWRGCIFMTAAAEFPLRSDPAHQAAMAHFQSTRDYIETLAREAGATQPVELADQLMVLVEGLVSVRHLTGQEHFTAIVRGIAKSLLDRHFAPCDGATNDAERPHILAAAAAI